MKYYLAARFPRRAEMKKIAKRFSKALPGSECVARWVFGGEKGLNRQQIAQLDLHDVKRADTLFIFTYPRGEPQPGGGRFVEMGYALALNKRVIVIGDYENVFCHTPGVQVFRDLEQYLMHEAPMRA